MRALADVARTLGLGRLPHARPRRGEHRRPRQGLDPRRHDGGGHRHGLPVRRACAAAATFVHHLLDPLMAAARPPSAPAWTGRPACRSSPPRPRSASRSTASTEEGPDHEKVFTASVGRRRRGPRRRAPAAARRRPSRRPPRSPGPTLEPRAPRPALAPSPVRDARERRGSPTTRGCLSSPRSRSSGAGWRTTSSAAASSAAEFLGARVARRHLPGPADLAARSPATRRPGAVAAASTSGWSCEAPDGHAPGSDHPPGHERPAARRGRRRPGEKHLHAAFDFADDGPAAAVRRPADLRRHGAGRPRRRRHARSRSPTSPPTRSRRRTTRPRSSRRMKARDAASSAPCSTSRWSAASATSTPTRRCGGRRLHGERDAPRSPGRPLGRLLDHAARGDGGGAGPGRHELRRAVRQRQRRQRLLRPVAARLRAGGPAVRPLRDADPAGVLHEPLVVLLPALPAATPQPAARLLAPRRRTPRRHSPG